MSSSTYEDSPQSDSTEPVYGYDFGYDSLKTTQKESSVGDEYIEVPHKGHLSGASQYHELHEMTTREFSKRKKQPIPAPLQQNFRLVDTIQQQPAGHSTDNPSEHHRFFQRSLTHADKFPLHLQRIMGTAKARQIEEASFGDSPSRTGHIPNFRRRGLSAPRVGQDYKSFYEGRVMASRVSNTFPDTIFVTPSMEAPAQVRSMGRGLGYTSSPLKTTAVSRSVDGTFMGSTVGGSSSGKLTEDDLMYKHKRQYAGEYPMLADRHFPERTAAMRRTVREREARVMRKKAAEGGGGGYGVKDNDDDEAVDPECRFRPVSLQQTTPVHPQYGTGKPVSSTYAMCGQVSYLPPDTANVIRTASNFQSSRAMGSSETASPPAIRNRRPKTSPYAVTTYSSFTAAAAPASGTATMRSFGSPSSDASPYAPPKKQARPPLRIAVHPTRY